MAPVPSPISRDTSSSADSGNGSWRLHATDEDFIIESWSEGFLVGALLIMAFITVANMRRGVLLHKLILTEQLLAMSHGTFCFMSFNGYGWYLSSTAALLYCSYVLHNFVAWMKIRPFFMDARSMFSPKTGKWVRRIYLSTLVCTIPPIILQIYDNFRFFNNRGDLYQKVRPYEPLMRDPWWVFTCLTLFHVVRKCYGTGVFELIRRSPRFGILLCAICFSMIFTTMDIVASIYNFTGSTDGINPWWKLSLVFKCLTDTIMLDDFKTELKRLGIKRLQQDEKQRQRPALLLNTDGKDDLDELEFADGLNTGQTRSRTADNSSPPNSGLNGRRNSPKECVGRSGTKISRLPALANFQFEPLKTGKRSKIIDPERQADEDEESPTTPNDRISQMRQSLGMIDYRPG